MIYIFSKLDHVSAVRDNLFISFLISCFSQVHLHVKEDSEKWQQHEGQYRPPVGVMADILSRPSARVPCDHSKSFLYSDVS